jgi:hypothetical protein
MAENNKFVTAINCMDGRVQQPVIDFMKSRYNADYVDMITEAGPNKILADCSDNSLVESIKFRVAISTDKHNSGVIAVVGHYDCGGNPAPESTQIQQIKKAVTNLRQWYENIEIIGIWVDATWTAKPVE